MNALAVFPAIAPDKAWIHDQLTGLVGLLADHAPGMKVVRRDLADLAPADAPRLPKPANEPSGTAPRCATRERSDELVAELEAAELLVIGAHIGYHRFSPALAEWYRRAGASKAYGAPLYAMGLDPQMQAWFTHVIRADRTFRYTAQGPRGLLAGKKALILAAHTGPWCREAMANHQVRCIHTQLRFMGIDDIATIVSDHQSNPVRSPRLWQPQPLAA